MAFLYSAPQITREHILRSAARQFREGDVQHWWHPETGVRAFERFARTICCGSRLWWRNTCK